MNVKDTSWLKMIKEDWSGSLRLHVKGRSMLPTLQPGDEVIVEPAQPNELKPGDWVVIQTSNQLLVHRFLTFNADGYLLTKGDAHRAPDPPWTSKDLIGRVTAYGRGEQIKPIRRNDLFEIVRGWWHRVIAHIWLILKSVAFTVLLLNLLLIPEASQAAVTLILFDATPATDHILVEWETGSEINMSGFYIWRAQAANGEYEKISEFIRHEGDQIFGAYYSFEDRTVAAKATYYYQLEAEETDGSSDFHRLNPRNDQLVSACINCPTPTSTPTEEPTATPTATSTPEPDAPTPIPALFARFWADATNLDAGQCTTLRWQTDHAARIELNGEGVPGSYSEEQVCPCADQSYTLRVVGHDGSVEESTITLNIRGACTPVPPGSTATPTRTPRPTRTPTPRPTRTRPIPTTTPRLTQTPHDAQTAPTTTPSPTAHIHSPLAMPETPTSMAAVSVLPSPTPNTAGFVPTRTPAPTGPGNVRDANARSGSAPGWPVIALLGGSGLIGAGGWGIWRAWKESDGA
jgi:signal peptidase I